jgi:hypothetical protein
MSCSLLEHAAMHVHACFFAMLLLFLAAAAGCVDW